MNLKMAIHEKQGCHNPLHNGQCGNIWIICSRGDEWMARSDLNHQAIIAAAKFLGMSPVKLTK